MQRTLLQEQESRRRGQSDPEFRRPDQPARAQRDDRGGARRRIGQRLRGGGDRGEIACYANRQGDRSDRGVQNSAGRALETIRRNAERMREINRCISSVAASLQQHNDATSEISRNVAGVASSTKEVVGVLDRVAGAVAQNYGTADTVLMAAEAMEVAATSLSDKVKIFLRDVAA
jgi:hypothetical protein